MNQPEIIVLFGGTSAEAAISRKSGTAAARALSGHFPVHSVELTCDAVPSWIESLKHIVFPVLHGGFGEDGRLQAQLEDAGVAYAGSGPRASQLCMHKQAAKETVVGCGFQVPRGIVYAENNRHPVASILEKLGQRLIIKPVQGGSSDGLQSVDGEAALKVALDHLPSGQWLIEQRITGREFSVGLLDGKALPIVEILAQSSVFDYASKYTRNTTQYRCPAPLSEATGHRAAAAAEAAFARLGCRDFARVDFLLSENDDLWFLEANTIPGLTPSSLLPKCAAVQGLNFPALLKKMLDPAIARYRAAIS